MNGVERSGIAGAHPAHEVEFTLPIHARHNALDTTS
jgi:hypothetical protein